MPAVTLMKRRDLQHAAAAALAVARQGQCIWPNAPSIRAFALYLFTPCSIKPPL